ncbi:N-acetylglucosaminyl transferase [Gammaproteobacteria bacterium]|nr:N-acetylglucosaminyl transferase [Gammaproteobacteria bacterium]
MLEPKRIMIMAGGTGGHIFPALALAQHLEKQNMQVEWLGAHGLETSIVPKNGYVLHSLSMRAIRGKGLKTKFLAPFILFKAVLEALRILKKYKADYVFGFGGFAAAPGGIAARILGIPLIIHEQNAVAGLTNRLLARLSTHVFSAFECSLPKVKVIGNPVRAQFWELPPPKIRILEREQLANSKLRPLNILIMGGSQGARKINQLIPAALKQAGICANIWHQTGAGSANNLSLLDEAQILWDEQAIAPLILQSLTVSAFIDDVVSAYGWADVVICRAGASTISELAASGVASILIPYPFAVDDHQSANARYLSDKNAAILCPQTHLTSEKLAQILATLSSDKCLEMAQQARLLAKNKAIEALSAVIA